MRDAHEEVLPEEVLYDKRLIDRHIKAGRITRQDVDKHCAAAADLAEQAAAVEIDAAPSKGKP